MPAVIPADAPTARVGFAAMLEAIPVGIAVVDADRRIVLMNASFHTSLGLDPGSFGPGTKVEDAVRASAWRGVYGPGDPEVQVKAVLSADHSRHARLRRRTFAGRSFDLFNTPLSDGGYIVTALDVSGMLAARSDAASALAQTATALATLRIGLAIFNTKGALLLSNPRFAELMDIPPERVLPGCAFQQMLEQMNDGDAFSGLAIEHGRPWTTRRNRGDGQLVDLMYDPLPAGGWALTLNDVTPLVQAQDEALRRARLLDSILLAVPHGICVYGPDRRVLMFNQTYQDVMSGAPIRIGDHLTDVIRQRVDAGEYGPGEPDAVFAQQLGFDITRTQLRRRVRPNGSAIDIRTAPLPDGGHVSVVTDITALVEAEALSRRRAEQMRAMLDCLHHGIMLWDANKRLVASNPIICQLYDLPPELLTAGRLETEIVEVMLRAGHFGVGEAAAASALALTMQDRSVPHAREFRTPAGRVLAVQSNPIPGGGWVSTIVDVTKTQAAEAELRQAKSVAEAANAAKSRFLATMSHELRTPLNAIIGFSDALLRQGAVESDVQDYGSQINAAGKQLLALINTVLDVARIESGRFDPGDEVVDVASLLRRAVRQAESPALAAEVSLECHAPDDLPWVRADERRLHQALSQLLSNAVKFTESGGMVRVQAEPDTDGGVRLSVADTGIGIPETELERVFEPFTQLDDTLSRRYGGTGLGLYTARAIVAAQGGEIRLSSQPGVGTTAEIIIPGRRVVR